MISSAITGVILSVGSSVFASAKDIISRKISGNISPAISAFYSFAFALPFYGILLILLYAFGYESLDVSWVFLLFVFLRALTDSAAEWFRMKALQVAELSLVAPFLSLATLFLLILSPLITGDSIPWSGVLSVLVVVIGSLALLGGELRIGSYRGVAYGLGCSLFFALNTCFDRLAVQHASPVFSGFSMTLLAAIFLLPALPGRAQVKEAAKTNLRPLILRGLFEVVFMSIKLSALVYLPAQYVSALTRVSLLFSVVGGRFLLHEQNFLRRLIAALAILIGLISITFFSLGSV